MLCPTTHVISEILDNEVVMIDLLTGNYYNMSESATTIWRCVMEGTTPAQICAAFGASSDDGSEVRAAVDTFLDQLRAEGLIEEVAEDPSPSPPEASLPAPSATGKPEPFLPPTLEKFTDMAHILLADPVHDADPTRGWPRTR